MIMKKTFNILLIGLISAGACAQNTSIVVEYKVNTQKKVENEKLKSLSPEILAAVKSQIAKMGTENKNLIINGSASKYLSTQEINDMDNNTSGVRVITMKSGASGEEIYKNTDSKQLIKQSAISDKKFIIESPLELINWTITSKTKTLGSYTVQEENAVIGGQETTAWFTKSIKSNQGPDQYWGLPGLILEVESPGKHIVAQKVSVSAKSLAVEIPKQGKKISQEEFNKLTEQKRKQLLDIYQNGGGF